MDSLNSASAWASEYSVGLAKDCRKCSGLVESPREPYSVLPASLCHCESVAPSVFDPPVVAAYVGPVGVRRECQEVEVVAGDLEAALLGTMRIAHLNVGVEVAVVVVVSGRIAGLRRLARRLRGPCDRRAGPRVGAVADPVAA